jgi:acyl dehydratase
VTGSSAALAHPLLAINMAIGMSTEVSQQVRANLFYRGLVLRRPVHIGDTLQTTTRVVALRQNRPQPDRPATGMAVLEIVTRNQDDAEVLHFWRCPMLPCRNRTRTRSSATTWTAWACSRRSARSKSRSRRHGRPR